MPVRRFVDADSDVIKCSGGTVNPLGAFSAASLCRRQSDDSLDQLLCVTDASDDSAEQGLYIAGGDTANVHTNGFDISTSTFTAVAADDWLIIAATKASGDVTPRLHKYDFGVGTWTHEDGDATVDNQNDVGGREVWHGSGLGFADVDLAAQGVWHEELTDTEVEELASAADLEGWLNVGIGPEGLWFFDQDAVTTAVTDETGNGADEISRSGTEVIAEDPPIPYTSGQTVTVGQAVETDTALALQRSVGQAVETDTALGVVLSTGPTTAIDSGPDDGSDPQVTFTFSSGDPDATFELRLDGGAWKTVTSPYELTVGFAGGHVVQVRAIDAEGTPDSAPAKYTWTSVAPTVPARERGAPSLPLTVWLQALDGTWEPVGTNRKRGVIPESLQLSANTWGADTCRFMVRRDPGLSFPDLLAFTPIIVEIGTRRVWEGRIWETPTGADGQTTVEGRGWQQHLDDDSFERMYVHANLGDWRDQRSFLVANLSNFKASGYVNAQQGQMTFGWTAGDHVESAHAVGVTLDLGQREAEVVYIEYDVLNTSNAVLDLFVVGHQTGDATESVEVGTSVAVTTLGDGNTATATFTVPVQYVTVYLYRAAADPAFTVADGADYRITAKTIRTFGEPAYESSGESALDATDIIKDALPEAPLLSSDTSDIDPDGTIAFDFPHFTLSAARNPREVMEAANAPHRYQLRVGQGRKVLFKPLPTVPLFQVGGWPGARFHDSSKNAAGPIFNRTAMTGQGPAGNRIRAEQTVEATVITQTGAPQPTNPSADTDTSGWTGSISRRTNDFDTSPASFSVDVDDAGNDDAASFSQTVSGFEPGTVYRLTCRARGTADCVLGVVTIGGNSDGLSTPSSTSWETVIVEWTQGGSDTATITCSGWAHNDAGLTLGAAIAYFDTFKIEKTVADSIPDRRGFQRTKTLSISQTVTQEVADKMTEVALENSKQTPLRGSVQAEGYGGFRHFGWGGAVAPFEVLLHINELVNLSGQIDPDTGALGRNAPMNSANYTHDGLQVQASLDTTRENFEALLKRYELVVGR